VVSERSVRAVAFAPAHVTGIFAPELKARDPRARGSIGAGLALELGAFAEAEFRPGTGHALRVTSDLGIPVPISTEVAHRLRPSRGGRLLVHLRHELPVGQGFGMSAAAAVATALAVARVAGRTRAEAIEVAHLADLFGRGGLGGVASIVGGGGLEFRRRGGIPPFGEVEHIALEGTLFVGVTGPPLPSPRLLGNDRFLARVQVASDGLDELLRHPAPTSFFYLSERFTDRLGLAPRRLKRVLRELRARGAWAGQAMFGQSFFARPKGPASRAEIVDWLERSGLRAVELAPASRGPHLRRPGTAQDPDRRPRRSQLF